MVCSGAIFNYVTMADSGVINSRHEPNSVQSLLQYPFERRSLAEKLKVKELGPDQPDGLIYCEELFVELCAAPPQFFHQPPLPLCTFFASFSCSFKEKCPLNGAKTQVKYVNPGTFLLHRYRRILLWLLRCYRYILWRFRIQISGVCP